MYVCVFSSEDLEKDVEFEVVGDAPDKAPTPANTQEEGNNIANGNKDSAQPSTSSKGEQHAHTHTHTTCSYHTTPMG